MKHLRPLMIVGTSSHAGKSIITAGLCRIFKQDGYRPAPFKSQNMSLNSAVAKEGGEIGRAQALQAVACGIEASVDMNPVLLKPTSDHKSQVILHGKVIGDKDASDYFNDDKQYLFEESLKSFDSLRNIYNPIVCEGAGSCAELNLKKRDIANLRLALAIRASVILVGDIERGGIFASLLGTLDLLEKEERRLIIGLIVNRFRGDQTLFDEGKKIIEERSSLPVIGVVPELDNLTLDEEDSLGLRKHTTQKKSGDILNVKVVLLPHISNYTDFAPLERSSRIHFTYIQNPSELNDANLIIIPGTKSTCTDLQWMRNKGIAKEILAAYQRGVFIMGICGGYQMLGVEILDPGNIDSSVGSLPGLSLLPVRTLMQHVKQTTKSQFSFLGGEKSYEGYEIHTGQTELCNPDERLKPFTISEDGNINGYSLGRVYGTYYHALFDERGAVDHILNLCKENAANNQPDDLLIRSIDEREHELDRLAQHLREHLRMDIIYGALEC